jgi:5'-nucleotidase
MKILLTNDDGYNAQGIRILYEKMQAYGEVILVAPHRHMSGASVSRAFWNEVQVHQHEANIFSVEGTPADAVSYALHGMSIHPDIVISGINDGPNISSDTVYSGTIGACMEALKVGKKTIAFSTDFGDFSLAKEHISMVMDYILVHDLMSDAYVLNVNFPLKFHSEIKGIRITELAFRPVEQYYTHVPQKGYRNRRRLLPYDLVENTDIWAIEKGYVSITPLKFGNQTHTGFKELCQKVKQCEG